MHQLIAKDIISQIALIYDGLDGVCVRGVCVGCVCVGRGGGRGAGGAEDVWKCSGDSILRTFCNILHILLISKTIVLT